MTHVAPAHPPHTALPENHPQADPSPGRVERQRGGLGQPPSAGRQSLRRSRSAGPPPGLSSGHSEPLPAEGGLGGGELPSAGLPQFLLPGILPPAARKARLDPGQATARAREFTRHVLRSWGLGVLVEDATLIVSELVSNALRHGGGFSGDALGHGVELVLCRRAGLMACAVIDPGAEATPLLKVADPTAEGGRGLHVIEALSAAWGWIRLGGREKAVWATLRVPRPDDGASLRQRRCRCTAGRSGTRPLVLP